MFINKKQFVKKGEDIYKKNLKKILETEEKGKIAAIDVDTGDYFIGDTVLKAGNIGKQKYPKKIFYFKRIGYKAVHSLKGVVKK